MAIHIHINSKDANPDGSISPDENAKRAALVQRAKQIRRDLETEARELGGPFRGPGIWAEVKKALAG